MSRRPPARLSWLAGLLSLYLIAPFVAGIAQFGLADWRSVDWNSLGGACLVSLTSATLATLLVSLGGIPLGYCLARSRGRRMGVLGFIVQLPLALPPLSSGILLLFLFGYASPIGRLTKGALTDSFAGIVLAEAFVAAPFLIIATRSAFAELDPVLEDVAATLGHRPWAIFMRVSLPVAWRSIAAGMLLAWLRGFGEFGATVMVAYHPYSLPVYTYVAFGSQGLPAMLPVLLPTLLAAMAVMALSGIVRTARLRSPSYGPAGLPSNVPLPVVPDRSARSPRSLSFAFHRALDGFDLDVAWRTNASRIAILGASGSGKSMTLRLIAGLDREPHGTLTLAGRDLSNCPPEQRRVAWVPQNYGLFPHLPVGRQVRFAVGSDPGLAHYWLDRFGLSGLGHRLPDALSLGQRQRVALARAFSRPAELLLLDEPFSALDAPLRGRLRRAFRALQADVDATTILVTHDPEEAFLLADELLILDAGRVLQAGPVEAVFARPANETVARLLGADNIAEGRACDEGHVDIGGGVRLVVAGPALERGAGVGWSVRPESIRITQGGEYPGEICDIGSSFGGRREVKLRIGNGVLRATLDFGEPVGPGPCRVSIAPSAVQVWMRGCGRPGDLGCQSF
jgi:ABC-type Fe3+/spermidine/putrescine transport system ATPase subunit/ABC-type sulfate transport system permease component